MRRIHPHTASPEAVRRRVVRLDLLGVVGHPRRVGERDGDGQEHDRPGRWSSSPVCGWSVWAMRKPIITMAQTAPTSMNGLRTRAQSERRPATTSPPERNAAYQTLIPLACGVRAVEDDDPVDREHAHRRVVEEQEHRDGDRRGDQVEPHHGADRVRVARSTSMPMARASTSARSRSVTISWSRSCGESSRRKKNAMITTPRHTSPEMMNWSCHGVRWLEGVRGHQAGGQGAHGRAERPEAHGHATAHLGREVPHQRRRRDEDDALDEPDHAVGGGEPPLVVNVRDGEQLDQGDDQRPVDGEVGPADLVGQARR